VVGHQRGEIAPPVRVGGGPPPLAHNPQMFPDDPPHLFPRPRQMRFGVHLDGIGQNLRPAASGPQGGNGGGNSGLFLR
jgi:hypothetical protein